MLGCGVPLCAPASPQIRNALSYFRQGLFGARLLHQVANLGEQLLGSAEIGDTVANLGEELLGPAKIGDPLSNLRERLFIARLLRHGLADFRKKLLGPERRLVVAFQR